MLFRSVQINKKQPQSTLRLLTTEQGFFQHLHKLTAIDTTGQIIISSQLGNAFIESMVLADVVANADEGTLFAQSELIDVKLHGEIGSILALPDHFTSAAHVPVFTDIAKRLQVTGLVFIVRLGYQ